MPLEMRERADVFLARPMIPWVAGAITALLVLSFWGTLAGPGVYHDERAYLVQARLLAAFSWTGARPPLPEFWEMAHVFVEPAIFAKYPPGHAPLLVPGLWLGLPGLVPVLCCAITGGSVFALARRVIGSWSAVAVWALWTSSPFVLRWQATYFSEVTTAALWLVALFLLLQWTTRERGWMLVALVATVGWLGITRPVTGIALGIPIALVVLRMTWRRRSLAGWQPALLVGVLIVAFVPWWSWRTIGSPTQMPYAHYSTVYFPWDMPGFVRDTSPPQRELPEDLVALAEATRRNYDGHDASRMVPNFFSRSRVILRSGVDPAAHELLWFVPVGLFVVGTATALVLGASFALLVATYLVMPHPLSWSVYYLEIFPVAPFFAVAGLAFLVGAALRALSRSAPQRRTELPRWLALAVVAYVALRVVPGLPMGRIATEPFALRLLVLEAMVDRLPDERVVVFIRRNRVVSPHYTQHDILGDPATTDRWMVRDLGATRNAELIAVAAGRAPYLYDEARSVLIRLGPDGRELGIVPR